MHFRQLVQITVPVAVVVGWVALLIWSIADYLRGDGGSGVLAAVLLAGLAAGFLFAIRHRHRNLGRHE
jgi:phosphotransferase system  glucose/maltose/N-acetylglucosamine-specific IIC component